MPIQKHEFPILEYDTEKEAVVKPNREHLFSFPEKALLLFLHDEVEKFAEDNHLEQVGDYISCTKIFPVYKLKYKGEDVVLCQAPVGAAASTQVLEFLISAGCKQIISAGSCGVMKKMEENQFIVPTSALRDEGTSYHYLPPSRIIDVNPKAVDAIKKALDDNGFLYHETRTWSTDGFFRETKEMIQYRLNEGCEVVEMECSALAACAEFRQVLFGQLLFTADSVAEHFEHRDWGNTSFPISLRIALDAIMNIK